MILNRIKPVKDHLKIKNRGRGRILQVLLLLAAVPALVACEKKLEAAEVEIVDPRRHYYPVIQGEPLGITYEIENVSKNPLFIQEIQTTCGCLVAHDELPVVILPNQTGKIHFVYNSLKNVGYVEHFAWLYGNFTDSLYREVKFDTNVVPPRDYTRDYEELWHEYREKGSNIKDLVDGRSTQKGYYTDDGIDPREQFLEETNDAVDELIGF